MLGVCVIVGGWRYGFGEWQNPGPGFMAVVAGVIIFFLSALWLVLSLVKRRSVEPTKKFFAETGCYKRVIFTLLAFLVYTFFFEKAGFIISTFLFLILLMKAVEPQSWKLTILVSLFVSILSVLIFQVCLHVPFPEGPLNIYSVIKWIY
jgi:putative tricarboxylic transport membrane protein